jgi:hypothetical protein
MNPYRYLQPSRGREHDAPHTCGSTTPPKIRHVTTWLLRRPEDLDATAHTALAAIRSICPHLERLGDCTTAFATTMVHRTGADLHETWLDAIEAEDLPELHAFARGIRQDYAAVLDGLSMPYSSGACEGNQTSSRLYQSSSSAKMMAAFLRSLRPVRECGVVLHSALSPRAQEPRLERTPNRPRIGGELVELMCDRIAESIGRSGGAAPSVDAGARQSPRPWRPETDPT